MRWKVFFLTLATLGVLHFLSSPLTTRLFNTCAHRIMGSALTARVVSLDLINAQVSLQNIRLAWAQSPQDPFAELRDVIIHWAFLPLLSKQVVLEEISMVGATFTIPPYPLQSTCVSELASLLHGKPSKENRMDGYWMEESAQGTIVHYPRLRPALVVHDIYLSDIQLRGAGMRPNKPPLPSLTNLNVTIHNLAACFGPSKNPTEFSLRTRLEGQEASWVKADGKVQRTHDGLNGSCEIRMEDLDIAALWPWINPSWLPQDFSQFQVTEGFMDLSGHLRITHGRWHFDNHLTLKKLKIKVDPMSPYRKIKGASPELVVAAVNTLGQIELQFGSYRQWHEAFEENVMKGMRNLIRKSIGDALSNLLTPP